MPETSERRAGTRLIPWVFPLALLPFGTVHAVPMLVIAALAGAIGTMAVLQRSGKNEPPRIWGVVAALLAVVLFLHALTLVPVGATLRRLAQPGLAERVESALALAEQARHPLALDPHEGLVHWALAAGLSALWLGTGAAVRAHRHRRELTRVLVGAGIGLSLLALAQRLTGASSIYWISGVGVDDTRQVFGTFVNENHGGLVLAILLPLSVSLLRSHELDARILGALGTTCGLAGVLLSGSRGAAATAVVALWALGALAPPKPVRRVVAAVGVLVALVLLAGVGPEGLLDQLNEGFDEAGNADPWSGRPRIWTDALALIPLAPILGVGPGSFQTGFFVTKQSPAFYRATHAHNEPLQVLVEHGVVPGLLLLLAVALAVGHGARVLAGIQTGRRRTMLSAWLASGLALGVASLVDFPMRIGAIAVLAALVLGVLLGGMPEGGRRLAGVVRQRWGRGMAIGLVVLVLVMLTWRTQRGAAHSLSDADVHFADGQTALALSRDDPDALARYEEAITAFSTSLRARPLDVQALTGLAQAQLLAGYPLDAMHTLQLAREVTPTSPWPHKYLARIHRALGDEALALASYRTLLSYELGTEDPAYAVLQEAASGSDAPLAAVLEAVVPDRPDRACLAGRYAFSVGAPDLAEKYYRLGSADIGCRVEASNRMLQLGRTEVALEMVAVTEHCSHFRAKGRVLLALERYTQAVEVWRAAQRACRDEDDRVRLGLARAMVGAEQRRGVDILLALADDAPEDAKLQRELIDAWCIFDRSDKAVEHLQALERMGKARPADERAARCPIGGNRPSPPEAIETPVAP